MIVNSLRLGQLDVPDDKIIFMEKPVLGFEHLAKFCLVEAQDLFPFMWLISSEDPAVSFLVVNPRVFFPDYRIEVNPKEIAELNIADTRTVETYVIVTIPDNPQDISINLQGPILINTENNRAKQLVLVNSSYQVRHHIMELANAEIAREERQLREPVGV
ncbi:MAG TPA: flagellar assembly protein FliW [candidate division Zixibacteria bacterium]|nr:flagellar assembly protein FliW [candidate division Zixibacteria bacterium]